jgi:hypothetical protein
LGGRTVANIAYRTLGVPLIDTARQHVGTKPLQTSAGTPTLDEIQANLSIAFENQDRGDFIIGMTTISNFRSDCVGILTRTIF